MPLGNETPQHLGDTIDALTSCVRKLNLRLSVMPESEREALLDKATELHQETRTVLAYTLGIVAVEEVPFS